MSPRRKSGLSKDDLDALEELPRVIRALEKFQEQHAKVRALMGTAAPEVRAQVEPQATRMFWEWKDAQGRTHSVPGSPIPSPEAGAVIRTATLDTPERREYEEAKRAGRKVPVADPFANASPAQRERMAEQRAIIDAERAARGLPTRRVTHSIPATEEDLNTMRAQREAAEADAGMGGEVVRTETLDTVSDGTTPLAVDADDDPEVH